MSANNGSNMKGTAAQLVRPRYFPRQVVTAADLTGEQDYFRERLRRHNRLLHGCGVVCGLHVLPDPAATDPPGVIVTAGLALSPQGDEIYLPADLAFPLSCLQDRQGDCTVLTPEPVVPQCTLAVRYVQEMVQPVPSLPDRCAPASTCEFSRFRDSYELACLDYLPNADCLLTTDPWQALEEYRFPQPPATLADISPLTACCPPTLEPWVVLAGLVLSPAGIVRVEYGPRTHVLAAQLLAELCLLGPIVHVIEGDDE